MNRLATAAVLLLSVFSAALCQQIAFTSRGHFKCPVVIRSFEQSKSFGFDSIVLLNDSAQPVEAIRFQVVFRTDAGDEPVDGRRVVVRMEPKDAKRVAVGFAQIPALRQKAKSARQTAGLAILSIESVEFSDGSVWQDPGPVEDDLGVPDLPKK